MGCIKRSIPGVISRNPDQTNNTEKERLERSVGLNIQKIRRMTKELYVPRGKGYTSKCSITTILLYILSIHRTLAWAIGKIDQIRRKFSERDKRERDRATIE